MASIGSSKVGALLILLNLIFFTCVSSSSCPPSTGTTKKPPAAKPHVKPPTTKPELKCPRDTLKWGVCAGLLGGVGTGLITEGSWPGSSCCSLLTGLTQLEAAVCLCTALKANVMGVLKLDVHVAFTMVINNCGGKIPEGYECA